MITRVPPGTWETLSFPSSQAAGDTAYQLQIDPRLRVRGRGDEPRTQRWYRQAKETKRGEMGGRESQHLIVPLKRGNQPEGPRRGKEVPSHEPLKGNMPGTLRPEPCPRNDDGSRGSRIHEMRNRVRVMCKPGSVGGLGGRPPRSTRPGRSADDLNHIPPVLRDPSVQGVIVVLGVRPQLPQARERFSRQLAEDLRCRRRIIHGRTGHGHG